MKKCPTCDKTFDDSLRFCQTDGTPLVDVSETASDPFKTVVSNQNEIYHPPADPFKTMVGVPPIKKDDNILQLSEERDSSKTQAVSQNEMRDALSSSGGGKGNVDDFDSPLETPRFSESSLNPPSFGDLSSQESKSQETSTSDSTLVLNTGSDISPPRIDSSPFSQESSNQSDFDNLSSPPIPSPFDSSMPPSYQSPSSPPFKEPEQQFGVHNDPFKQSPFEQPQTPFGQQQSAPYNAPLQQTEWTPPPAPVPNWQDQGLGANTPFQPPVVGAQNQTLAIVSLVCGILSVICCFSVITGPAGLITGFMAKNKAEQNPNEFGGRGMALAGMITGAIGTLIGIGVIILQVLGAFAGRF